MIVGLARVLLGLMGPLLGHSCFTTTARVCQHHEGPRHARAGLGHERRIPHARACEAQSRRSRWSVGLFQRFHGGASGCLAAKARSRHKCVVRLLALQGNYAGEDSPYARAKADDEKKKAASRAKIEARKARGFTELADTLRASDAKKNAAAAKAAKAPPPKAKAPAKAPPSLLPDFKPPQLPKIKAPWDK